VLVVIVRVSVLDQTKRCCPLDHGKVKRCNFSEAAIAKLQSSSAVLLLRDISLRTFFLNGVSFDLFESVLNTCVNGRFVQWRWSASLWQKRILSSVTVAKRSFFCNTTFCLNKLTKYKPPYNVTLQGRPHLSLKCRLPNRNSFDVFDRCFCKVETRACETLRSCAKRLGGLAVTTLPGASRSFNPALRVACVNYFQMFVLAWEYSW